MNCKAIQQQLLESESPDRPGADVQAHLDGCAACREWQGRLIQIEHGVRRLQVPGSATRDAFLLDLVLPDNAATETVEASSDPVVQLPLAAQMRQQAPPFREVAWRWRYAIAGVAAAVGLFALVSWSLQDREGRIATHPTTKKAPAPDPLVANLMQQNLTLVAADKPPQRADALGHMAEDLDRESRALDPVKEAELVGLLSQLQTRVTAALQKLKPGAAVAVAAAGAPADAHRVKQLQRNRGLIQTLVEGGLRLAAESSTERQDGILNRADACSDLAKGLAKEISLAAQTRGEADRTVEMGQHLHDLLQRGIATNLRVVRRDVQSGSAAEKQMEKVRDWVVKDVALPLENQLNEQLALVAGGDRENMQKTIDAIRGARKEVESAVRG